MLDTNTDLSKLLNDPDLLATKAYLAGEWRDPRQRGDEWMSDVSPGHASRRYNE